MANKSVLEVLSDIHKEETVYYRSNPGNAGDALIATGTFKVFDELGINYEFIDPDDFDATNKIVIYAGGGNLNHIYSDARQFMEKHHRNAKLFVLLPHTITENTDLLSSLGGNCVIFARELVSFNHIEENCTNCQTYLDHDMAFHINVNELRSRIYPSIPVLILTKLVNKAIGRPINDLIPSIKQLANIFVFELRSSLNKKESGNFFRKDVEASVHPIPNVNADLSVIYELSTRSREIVEYTVWLLFRYLEGFDSVITDRLHICIASALLGKRIEFHSNSYFKCRAVYEYSLKNNFEAITWIDHG